ncbi:TlpA family protein disulfide reductase [Sphingobacterium sp. UDSM-2020]|uniref:TlpA family protein disulfide reductase n=1 Tax=Sphingobacterium sp. UDSM-2020 TaxID=2795738 RepID=UPI0019352C77|nr:TlpA disulfide reductase family protein [Sphingobacterium sp. UDSM-2020]QQD14399.1 TlpA family protein disulfide reductase [Sphingobacterium sp. UDSM-2020]
MTLLYAGALLCPNQNKNIYQACPHGALAMCGRHFLITLCFMLFSIGATRSQSPDHRGAVNNTAALNIGDPIPDALWNTPLQVVNHPDDKETIKLNEYKDKLIILDFWATWCGACIGSFPKVKELQNEFGDKIKILAVTKEDSEKINHFFKIGIGKEYPYINSVFNDVALSQYFPHRIVPHIAWISPNGEVLNITSSIEINRDNIQTILNDNAPQMRTKADAPPIDRNRPMFISENFDTDLNLQFYSVFVKGYHPGLPMGNKIKKTKEGKIYGRQMNNASMMNIYRAILNPIFEKKGEKFSSKRVVLEVKEPNLLVSQKDDRGYYKHDHLYNYELIVPHDKTDSLFDYMLADLNRYSDYIGTIENRMVDCLVLVKISSLDKIKAKGDKSITSNTSGITVSNRPISHFVNILNSNTMINLPIIDETEYSKNIDITISDFTDLDSLKNELHGYGLDLIPAKRSLNMFVIKDK